MKKPKRKAERLVSMEDIIKIAFEDDLGGTLIEPTLIGHLALEALIVEFLEFNDTSKDYWKLSFPDKTALLVKCNLISPHLKDAFDEFNEFRNDLAHIFAKSVHPADVHALAGRLEKMGVDFSDSVGRQPLKEALDDYGGEVGILKEVMWCLLHEITFCMMEKGARDLVS